MFSQWDQLGQKLQEKDGPEEEEDFDDLTQDQEDEVSSASEESVLCPGTPVEIVLKSFLSFVRGEGKS
ncbi:hypothetical protein JEQ12_000966 [Ovis aries]|uniref:Uncharacterized protein n=1 Tax=Ovis aries TaxID=9940 RepID=A0A836D8E9_SHEEP|nr:hypothetical protein JEQ12_000966 [Ovis aries]